MRIGGGLLLALIIEVKLEEVKVMIEKDAIVLAETGDRNISTVFQFLNKDFDEQISDEWMDVLLDVQKEAESITQIASKNEEKSEEVPTSAFVNARPEITGGSNVTKSSAIVGTGKISISIVCKIKQRRPKCRLICKRFGIVIVRRCPRN